MAVNFPSNPTNGQTITASGITYVYDSTQGVWSDSPQGLTQAIDALTDVDTSTVAPTNGQVLQWNSTDSEWQPADSSAGVTVYATINDLPLSGVAEGSMALVDSTDKLYIFSDAGWYSITLVNTTPSISGVNATYTLASDGTATVVTVTATDPEGIPLTYSIVSDTSGNIATVTQGTGANTNQWTITPSTNTANAGNFTLVFRASDGTNIASASSTFTLQFTVENSNYTTALITSVGANNAVNNSFTDSSSNSHTITANGNVTQNTFSPYRHGGYSTYFDGNGDYLGSSSSSDFAFGTGDFTVEFWFYATSIPSAVNIVDMRNGSSGFVINFPNGVLGFYSEPSSSTLKQSSTLNAHEWYHVAAVRNGTNFDLYVNGTAIGSSATDSSNFSANTTVTIGARYTRDQQYFPGYISNVRLVKGTAVYTSAFTPPTERLTAVTNTSLLTCHLPYIADGSTNSHSITVNGNTKTEPFSPYDYGSYSTADNGGSIYFDGTGDSLTIPASANFAFGTGDFTIEFWGYFSAIDNFDTIYIHSSTSGTIQLFFVSGKLRYNNNSVAAILDTATTIPTNQLMHFALVRSSGTSKWYLNGVEDSSVSDTTNWTNSATNLTIGRDPISGRDMSGYLSDFRVVKGTAVYTSAFTPPTAPLTAITNTSLLLNCTDAGIIDKSQSVKVVTLDGSAKSSTTQTKYLTSSMSFAAQTDFLKVELPSTLGTGDFTIEWWAYFTNINPGGTNYRAILDMRHSGDTTNLWLQQSGDGSWLYYPNYPTTGFTSSTFSNNTWYHIAIARENGTIRFYVDGSLTGSGSDSFDYDSVFLTLNHYSTSSRRWTGYASDLRVTKGLARYTAADETANIPSAALGG